MAQSPKGGRYHHGDLRIALIRAASDLLEKDGPEAISFRAAARAAGVSQTAPYNHFESKEDLLATVAAAGFRKLEASQMAARADAPTARSAILAMGLDYVRFALANPQLYRLMFGGFAKNWHGHALAAEAKTATFAPIQSVLAEFLLADGGASQDAIRTAAMGCWSLVHGLAMLCIDRSPHSPDHTGGDPEVLAGRVIELFVKGLDSAKTI